jgi:transcription antitermination factor NusA-like protein
MLVPEIKEGLVSVKDVVGLELCSYVIIVLWGVDPKSDPIRACMGPRGSNLFKLSDEMHISRNKIKLAIYDQNVSKFAMNLFKDSDVLSVKIDENNENRVRVIVPEDRVKDAIGVGGYKAKVASRALKRSIEVKGVEEEKKEQEVYSAHMVAKLTNDLKVDNPIAQFLVSSGLESVKKIAEEDAYRICMKIPGFGIEIAKELISRAQEFIQSEEGELMSKISELQVKQELYEIFEISLENCVNLGAAGIKSISDISKTSSYQLMKICHNFTKADADNLIKNAIGYLSYEGE